jgi:hypothetical protein
MVTRCYGDRGLCACIQAQAGDDFPEQRGQMPGTIFVAQGNGHEVFLFFYQPHPVMNNRVKCTFQNVRDTFGWHSTCAIVVRSLRHNFPHILSVFLSCTEIDRYFPPYCSPGKNSGRLSPYPRRCRPEPNLESTLL